MKTFGLFAFAIAFTVVFVISTVAQTKKTQIVILGKIGAVNAIAFEDEKSGIKDLVIAYEKLFTELKPKIDELKNLSVELQEIEKEILRYKELLEKDWTGHSNSYSKAKAKFEEYEKLYCEFNSKNEDFKYLREQRKLEIVASTINTINGALKQFAKQNGYMMILDSSQNNSFVIIEREVVDITEEFIKFYNSSPKKEKL